MRPFRWAALMVVSALVGAAVVAASALGVVSRQTQFTSVSCTSTSSCMAVGFFLGSGGEHTLAERFNGRRWSIERTPSPGTAPALWSVSCPSMRFCMAVGNVGVASGSRGTVAELWNGSRWRLSESLNPWGANSALDAVSCPQADWCMAIGGDNAPRGANLLLLERYSDGAWTTEPLAAPAGTSFIHLDAISCPSETSCLAVGTGDVRGRSVAIAERYANGAWADVPLDVPGRQPTLNGVSCLVSGYCLAVGDENLQGSQGPIAVAFSSASTTELSPGGGSRSGLEGVDCLAAARCVTVGATTRGNVARAYSETLRGTRWRSLQVANPGIPDALTGGLWCRSLGSCVAAGYYAGQGAEAAPLSEVLLGGRWRAIPGVAKQL